MITKRAPRGTPLADRIKMHVRVTAGGCWEWQGSRSAGGYGRIGMTSGTAWVHRVSYEAFVGPIPHGLQVDHLCRNRACCNPAHLEPVTAQENVLRSPVTAARINASKTHCKYGHEFTPENTYVSPRKGRYCRTCKRADWHRTTERRSRERQAARAAASP